MDEAIADCSTIFNFSMADYLGMTLTELGEWRERARRRSGANDE